MAYKAKNQYNKMEFAGALGDLGTFIPFVVAYISINKIDPAGILLAFGLCEIFVGLYFKTPIPVQPMKAIGSGAISRAAVMTHGTIWGAGLFTAIFWTIMGFTGAIEWLNKISPKPMIKGILLGLGMSFISQGLEMIIVQPIIAIIGIMIIFLFINSTRFPAMLLVLIYGFIVAIIQTPDIFAQLSTISIQPKLPELAVTQISWNEFLMGTLVLGLPQIALTLGNSVIGTVTTNNELFPDRKTSVKTIALNLGFMNFLSTFMGGVPLCHGAGGMAAHVRFGAKTGGALVILGVIVTIIAIFFSNATTIIFKLFPIPVLGAVLFFAGLELASSIKDIGNNKSDIYVTLLTAGIAMWNMGWAFLGGLALFYAMKKNIIKI